MIFKGHGGLYVKVFISLAFSFFVFPFLSQRHGHHSTSPLLEKCKSIHRPAGKSDDYSSSTRTESDRFVRGTLPVLIRNAKILTGARNGTEVVFGDLLLDKGIVQALGYVPSVAELSSRLQVVDAEGRWVTPGLVDLHSHLGVYALPKLSGASDGNSDHQPINPFLRSVDGLNTHDDTSKLTVAGGVTTAQVLPGSANNIGGQAVLIKLRPTAERSVSAMVLEPPKTMFVNSSTEHDGDYIPWRHMKHACGENPNKHYGQSRMDAVWNFRHAYDQARALMEKQNTFCEQIEKRRWSWPSLGLTKPKQTLQDFPDDLELEALVDVLRGRVKLSIHCYESVDLDGIIRLSNEFKFPVASFHHASETYLVPHLLKKTWGGAPATAIFAANARKKREAYRGSEFAPRILADNGISVIMKSDHPVINSRYLMYEAQQAHYFGLNPGLAIASVTTTPANVAGVGWRVGKLEKGYDADLVIWDSHPLALGATPVQVYIDGIPQLETPHTLSKPDSFQNPPRTPNWDKETADVIKWEGLPPLAGNRRTKGTKVRLTGVKSYWTILAKDDFGNDNPRIKAVFDEFNEASSTTDVGRNWTVLIEDGKVSCYEPELNYLSSHCRCCGSHSSEIIDLKGGSISPGLTTFGSPLGLREIRLEPTTNDGLVLDPLTDSIPSILGEETIIRAVDGLQFGGRSTLLAYRDGITQAITAPTGTGFMRGLLTAFDIGARHSLEDGAIIQEVTALQVAISLDISVSVSTQIAALRAKLLRSSDEKYWELIRKGQMPLVIQVDSADIMASLIQLKYEVEEEIQTVLRFTFVRAAEAHLLAKEIAKAKISIIFSPSRPFPATWESRRILPGPPLTRDSQVTAMLKEGVHVAIGVEDEFDAKNLRFDIGWVALESNSTIGKEQALALGSINVERALGLTGAGNENLVIYSGGDVFAMESKVIGTLSSGRDSLELFD